MSAPGKIFHLRQRFAPFSCQFQRTGQIRNIKRVTGGSPWTWLSKDSRTGSWSKLKTISGKHSASLENSADDIPAYLGSSNFTVIFIFRYFYDLTISLPPTVRKVTIGKRRSRLWADCREKESIVAKAKETGILVTSTRIALGTDCIAVLMKQCRAFMRCRWRRGYERWHTTSGCIFCTVVAFYCCETETRLRLHSTLCDRSLGAIGCPTLSRFALLSVESQI